MKSIIRDYHKDFLKLIDAIQVTDKSAKRLDFYSGVELACNIIKRQSHIGGKIFFIGNGGSAAIASHMVIDFCKNGKIPAMAFNDSSLLTCLSNDFGYENVFAKPIELFAQKKDILFAISSSGKSKNILNATKVMLLQGAPVITLSGFSKKNPLVSKGICNFHVPSHEYGLVEVIHQYICHLILDMLILVEKGVTIPDARHRGSAYFK